MMGIYLDEIYQHLWLITVPGYTLNAVAMVGIWYVYSVLSLSWRYHSHAIRTPFKRHSNTTGMLLLYDGWDKLCVTGLAMKLLKEEVAEVVRTIK